MSAEPLRPFSPPTAVFDYFHISGTISFVWVIAILLSFVLIFWAVYTLVAIYHWFKYSHASWVAVPAVAIHLVVSFLLIVFALTGTFFL